MAAKLRDMIPRKQRNALKDLKKMLPETHEVKREEKETRQQELKSNEIYNYVGKMLKGK